LMKRGHTWHPAFSIFSVRNRTVGSARPHNTARGQQLSTRNVTEREKQRRPWWRRAGRVLWSAERMPSTHSSRGMARRVVRFGSEDSASTRTPAAPPLPLPLPPFPSAISAPRLRWRLLQCRVEGGLGLAVGPRRPSLPWLGVGTLELVLGQSAARFRREEDPKIVQ